MINLVLICEHYFPEIGGLERSTHRLAQSLISKGNQVTVLAPLLPDTSEQDSLDNVKIVRSLHCLDAPFTSSDASRSVMKRADAILVFGIGDDQKAKIWEPVFQTENTPKFLKIGTAGDTKTKGVPADIIRKFTGIFCQNEEIVEEVKALGFSDDQCHRVRNGMDVKFWQNNSPDKLEARRLLNVRDAESVFVISAIGRFVKRKRFPDIINAFAHFVQNGLKASLLLHGSDFGQSDGEEGYIRQHIQTLGIPKSAEVKIITPNYPTAYTLAASDISVSMGTREGAPNIILESLASGVPVIASDISGHRVYIDEGKQGWFLDSNNIDAPEKLSRIFSKAINCDDLEHMRGLCREAALAFDISKTSEMYLQAVHRNLG